MLISDNFSIAALKFPQDQPNCFSERHGKKCNFSLKYSTQLQKLTKLNWAQD
jgi:hypothetical protein